MEGLKALLVIAFIVFIIPVTALVLVQAQVTWEEHKVFMQSVEVCDVQQ